MIEITGEPTVTMFLRDTLRPGMVVYDCGAFHGWITTLAAQIVGPEGEVHAFEPTAARAVLEANVRGHRADLSNVRIRPEAIGEASGHMAFVTSGDTSDQSGHLSADGTGEIVPVTTIDAHARGHGRWPDVVKLDIEGHETAALRGAAGLIQHGALFILEQQEDPQARHLLMAAGYQLLNLHTYGRGAGFPPGARVQNYLAWRPDPAAPAWWEVAPKPPTSAGLMAREADGAYATALDLPAGRHLIEVEFALAEPWAMVSYSVASPSVGRLAHDGEVIWIHGSYRQIPWFLDRPERVEVRLDPMGGSRGVVAQPQVFVRAL